MMVMRIMIKVVSEDDGDEDDDKGRE